MDKCYVLEPSVIQELSHSLNLGMWFLQEYNLKMICTEEEFLGCIFVENHTPECLLLKKGQTIGLVMSCVVTQEEQGQTPVERVTQPIALGRVE